MPTSIGCGASNRAKRSHVLETIRILRRELEGRVPLIGFAGAPFTLASHAIEGGPSTSFAKTKALMYAEPHAWHRLLTLLAEVVGDYLVAQIEAGAQAVQVFDSWVGSLSPADYREFALPHSKRSNDRRPRAVDSLRRRHVHAAAADARGRRRRHRSRLARAAGRGWRQVGDDRGAQGNLDPTLLLGPKPRLLAGAVDVLRRADGRPGHIFNLGHGILPTTPVEHGGARKVCARVSRVGIAAGCSNRRAERERGVAGAGGGAPAQSQ